MANAEAEAQAPQEEVPAHADPPEVNFAALFINQKSDSFQVVCVEI